MQPPQLQDDDIKYLIGIQTTFKLLEEQILPGPHQQEQLDRLTQTRNKCLARMVGEQRAKQLLDSLIESSKIARPPSS